MKNEIIKLLQTMTEELGKVPTRTYFVQNTPKEISQKLIVKEFGSFTDLIKACNLPTKKETVECICDECQITFERARYLVKPTNNFCSRSCNRTYQNKTNNPNPKIDRTCTCENCNITFNKTKDQVSNTCSMFCYMELGMKQRLMKDVIKRNDANKYDTVRKNARLYSKYFYPAKCMVCDYDKHYEVCHVKDLKDFTREETIYEVNNKTNLIHLCPNCHWEFDHNQLDLQKIREAQNLFINNL